MQKQRARQQPNKPGGSFRWSQRLRIPPLLCGPIIVMLLCTASGAWWQSRPAGPVAGAALNLAVRNCPTVRLNHSNPTVGESIRVLDRWALARLAERIDGRDRCRR